MTTLNVTAIVTDNSGLTGQGSGTLDVTAAQPPVPMNFGEELILATDDFGNGNLLLAQKENFAQGGPLDSLSFYNGAVSGQQRLAIFDSTGPNGRPGNLIWDSGAYTPAANSWTKRVSSNKPIVAQGFNWLAYSQASNNMHFRNGPGGEHVLVSRTFGAMPAVFPTSGITAGTTHWSFYATVLVEATQLPPPGTISHFVQTAANWSDPSIIDNRPWYNHHGGRTWSLTKVDSTTLRMEVRQGDPEAIEVGGERSEISGGWVIQPTDLIDVEFDYTLEPGAAFVVGQNNLAWATIDQIHGDVRPSWIGYEANERIFLTVNPDVAFDQREWHSPAPLVRGQTYRFRHQVQRSPNTASGFVKLWMDGTLVADFTGIRVGGVDNYVKLGLYRGWNGLIPQTTAVRYANIRVR